MYIVLHAVYIAYCSICKYRNKHICTYTDRYTNIERTEQREPWYDFDETYDEDGNPIWRCECHVEGRDIYYWAENSSKKQGKKSWKKLKILIKQLFYMKHHIN